jgi:hypothetical protein
MLMSYNKVYHSSFNEGSKGRALEVQISFSISSKKETMFAHYLAKHAQNVMSNAKHYDFFK